MSIIKCPECRNQVSTMAGTCPNCGTKISGQLRNCPNCGGYCLLTQDKCPECGTTLPDEPQATPDAPVEKEKPETTMPEKKTKKKKKRLRKGVVWFLVTTIIVLLCAVGYHYYSQHQRQQREQADYERLADVTNPDFYQQFLIDYPESEHSDEIRERMLVLQAEAKEWEQVLKNVTRSKVTAFMQSHPTSLRQRICEDMLDSIDWQAALAIGNEEAVTDYLAKHPSGRHVTEAAEKKNSLLLTKVTPEERAMLRGTLEAFFSKAIANQDTLAAREAIPDTTMHFCGNKKADAEAIIQYAQSKMAKDVIGLHYIIGEKMQVHKVTLPDSNSGFSVEVNVQEAISRSDTSQPTSNRYRVNALINQEQKIVRLNIVKD